jgi:hypothetical protein
MVNTDGSLNVADGEAGSGFILLDDQGLFKNLTSKLNITTTPIHILCHYIITLFIFQNLTSKRLNIRT